MPLLIFDLDGTLIDSKLDLIHAVNATRVRMGMEPLEHDLVCSYVGNGAPTLVRRALGPEASEADVTYALDHFLAYYRDHMLDHTVLYPGVREALHRFEQIGIPMAVLTNKPVRFSQAIIDGLGLTRLFFRVYGGNSFEQKKPDPIGVDTLLAESGQPRASTWMVGDSAVDIRTARNAGIEAIGVTYGFQPEGFLDDPPDLLVNDLGDAVEWVVERSARLSG
jgi:phosphoglycolate phosphatase